MNCRVIAAALLGAAALSTAAPRYCLRAESGAVTAYALPGWRRLPLGAAPVSALRKSDREILEKGLYFSTFPELTRACEDFCS